MDTLVITPEQLTIVGTSYDAAPQPPTEGIAIDASIDSVIYIKSAVFGYRKINNTDTLKYPRIGFGFGGIEWSVTCVIPGEDDDPDTPVALSPKTYVDAYGKLHLGDEVEVGMVLTVDAKLVNCNPSGAGYEIAASDPVVIRIITPAGVGNFNHAERFPYIVYQDTDSPTPASGAGIGDAFD